MTQTLLPRFADLIRNTPSFDLAPARSNPLQLGQFEHGGKQVDMVYAPFDHVNAAARITIVGMTPGAHQAREALMATRGALLDGRSISEAAQLAKVHASFSGEPMRGNLIRMMDRVGIAKHLNIATTAALWTTDSRLVHFTSALRYPVFVDGKNWSGTPDMVRTPQLRDWLLRYTGQELATLAAALIVPLGPKVAAAMYHLADEGLIDARLILDGMPHPSGANQERVASFLGDKADHLCSAKTNPNVIAAARERLIEKVRIAALAV